eukprot:82947-Chlamydomonas_euryale.AAC.1
MPEGKRGLAVAQLGAPAVPPGDLSPTNVLAAVCRFAAGVARTHARTRAGRRCVVDSGGRGLPPHTHTSARRLGTHTFAFPDPQLAASPPPSGTTDPARGFASSPALVPLPTPALPPATAPRRPACGRARVGASRRRDQLFCWPEMA